MDHALLELSKKGFALRQHGAETLNSEKLWEPQFVNSCKMISR